MYTGRQWCWRVAEGGDKFLVEAGESPDPSGLRRCAALITKWMSSRQMQWHSLEKF